MRDELRKSEPDLLPLSDTAMAHLYRGELGRSDRWRTRLDTTTNWALTTTAAVISFGFANAKTPHVTLLVGIWMVFSFLMIEARRYRYYDLWNRRLRLLEDGYWAPMLRREPVDPDAMRELAQELARPQIQLSLFSAVAVRMNRAYGPILLVLLLTWFVKVYSHPRPAASAQDFLTRAHIGPVPGLLVTGILTLLTVAFILLLVMSLIAKPPMGELRSRPRSHKRAMWEMFYRPYQTPRPRRQSKRPTSQEARGAH